MFTADVRRRSRISAATMISVVKQLIDWWEIDTVSSVMAAHRPYLISAPDSAVND